MEARHTSKCLGCNPPTNDNLLIETELGRLVLHILDQGPIGRCLYIPKKHIWDVDALSRDHQDVILEVYRLAARVQKALQSLYGAQKIAVCMIGNLTRDEKGEITEDERYEHRHFHIIPTYARPVVRYGTEFVDHNYAKPLNLDPHRGYIKLAVDAETLEKIRTDFVKALADVL
jgi:diadenosine tetraphosphate (Ap4A) HIT family hydrolase